MDKSLMRAKDSEALSNFLNTDFSKNERAVMVDKICEGCLVPKQTVYNWCAGNCRIPELHKRKIEEIIGKQIFVRLETA